MGEDFFVWPGVAVRVPDQRCGSVCPALLFGVGVQSGMKILRCGSERTDSFGSRFAAVFPYLAVSGVFWRNLAKSDKKR